MTDWGRSGRRNTFSAVLVDPFSLQETGQEIEMLEDAGSITWDIDADNYYSATLNLTESPSRDYMIRVKQHIDVDDASVDVTLGTFFVDKAPGTVSRGSKVYQAACYSPMLRYTKDITTNPVYWPQGTVVQDALREQVEQDGGKLAILSDVNMHRAFGNDIFFPDDYKRNDLLTEMAYWIGCRIYPDEFGYISLEPYQSPEDLPLAYTFDASNSTYKRGYQVEDLASDSYNKWVVKYSNSEKSDFAVSTLPATHPFSFDRIGRWVTYSESIQDEVSHEELQALADRRREENSVHNEIIQIEHVSIPSVKPYAAVRYENTVDGDPMSVLAQVTQIDMSLNKTAMCTSKLKVIL